MMQSWIELGKDGKDDMLEEIDLYEVRLRRLEQMTTSIVDSQSFMAQAMQRNTARLDKIEARLDRIEKRLDALEERMNHLEQRMDHLEQRMAHLELRMESVEMRLESLEKQVSNMMDVMTMLNDNVAYIKNYIERKGLP